LCIQAPYSYPKRPPNPALHGFPKEDPSTLTFIDPARGGYHFTLCATWCVVVWPKACATIM